MMAEKHGNTMLKHEISDDKRHQQNSDTSYMTKDIGNILVASIAFAASLATTFAIFTITITTTFLLTFLKSLINFFTGCKSITSPNSRTGTFFPAPTKSVPNRYHARHERNISSTRFIPKFICKSTVLPQSSKRTLFLGLGRILVNFIVNEPCNRFDFVVHPVIKGKRRACYVMKRPGLDEFLCAAKNASVEVVIYTSECNEYADPIIDRLDPMGKLITHRLYRNACTKCGNGLFMKDLVSTGGQLDQSLIIDDNPKKHVKQWGNAIAVRPFLGDHTDTDLINLAKFIEVQRNFNDIWQLIQLKRLGIIYFNSKDNEEFGMAAYRLSLLQSLNLSSSVTNFAYSQLCLDFKSSPPPLEQSLKLISPLNHLSNYLVKVTLKDSKLPETTIPVLQRLTNLTALSLVVYDYYNEKNLKFLGSTFLKLEILNLEDQDNLSSVTFEEQCMPELKELSVTSSNFDFVIMGIGNLLKLKKIQVHCGKEENAVQDMVQQ